MAANLLLGRALQVLDAAGGMVVFWDADGRWNKDSFTLPGRPDRLEQLAPVLEALLEWTLYTEKPVAIDDLSRSRWSRHLLHGDDPPAGAIAGTAPKSWGIAATGCRWKPRHPRSRWCARWRPAASLHCWRTASRHSHRATSASNPSI